MSSTILQNVCRMSQNIFSTYLIRNSNGRLSSPMTNGGTVTKLDDTSVMALKKLMAQITLDDLGIDLNELSLNGPAIAARIYAPITFTSVFENQFFSLTVFGFRYHSSVIPMHDHPGMHGFIKCVHGRLSIKSYSLLGNHVRLDIPGSILAKVSRYDHNSLVPALYLGDEVISAGAADPTQVCTLTPTTGNLHEIRPLTNVAVMADIIAPPYTAYTKCYFYHVVDTIFDSNINQNVTWMLKTMHTDEYYCDTVPFTGDKIIV